MKAENENPSRTLAAAEARVVERPSFEGKELTLLEIDGEAWFVAQEVGQALGERELLNRDVFKVQLPTDGEGFEEEPPILKATLFDLLDAFQKVIEQAPKESLHEVMPQRIRLVDRIVEVLDMVTAKQSLPFEDLFDGLPSREGIIVTFLSILELVRLRLIRAYQFEAFGAVQLRVLSDENDQRERLKETLKSRES